MEKKRNQCEFVGNLVRDPDLRDVGENKLVSFTLAVSNDYKKGEEWIKRPASFLDFVLWGDKAPEFAALKKGQPVNVEGKAEVDQWEDKETRKKRSRVKFRVFDFVAIERGVKQEVEVVEESEPPKSTPKRGRPPRKVVEDDDEDVPF